MIGISAISAFGLILFLTPFFPAPLQEGANPAITPNPVKSAWFLLWIQEVVSWSSRMIYPLICLALIFAALPWIKPDRRIFRARWFPREQIAVNMLTLIISAVIVALTITAMFFRGRDWLLTLSP